MKRCLILAAAVMCLMFSSTARASETLIASGHPEYAPIMWRHNNSIVGAGPELIRLIFKDLNVTVKTPYSGDWKKVQQEAKEGRVDILVGLYMTQERKAFFEYSNPYAKDPVVVFVAKGKGFPYSKWDDLIGKKGTTTTGDSFGQTFDKFLSEKLTVTRSVKVEDNFSKLLNGRADYFIYAMYSGLFEADKLGIANKVELLSKEVCVENWYIAVSKKSPYVKYLPEINKKLDELINNGTVDRLIEKYGSQYRKSIATKKKGSPAKAK